MQIAQKRIKHFKGFPVSNLHRRSYHLPKQIKSSKDWKVHNIGSIKEGRTRGKFLPPPPTEKTGILLGWLVGWAAKNFRELEQQAGQRYSLSKGGGGPDMKWDVAPRFCQAGPFKRFCRPWEGCSCAYAGGEGRGSTRTIMFCSWGLLSKNVGHCDLEKRPTADAPRPMPPSVLPASRSEQGKLQNRSLSQI